MNVKPYRRRINYYETDQMQVVHHSNYARYLEESRLDLMDQMGLSYARLEHLGIIIPVLELHDYYTMALHFGETVMIYPHIYKLSPVRFWLRYEIRGLDGTLLHKAETVHGFVDKSFRPMNLKKQFPEVFRLFEEAVESGMPSMPE